jgi:hypothetical protein
MRQCRARILQAAPEGGSRELSPGVPAYPSIGGRIAFTGTLAALFGVPGFQRSFRLRILDDKMAVMAELALGRAPPRMVERFQDSHEDAPLLPVLPRLDLNVTSHR